MEKVTSRLAPSFLPSTAVLEMTYLCNHKCLFCSCPWENKNGKFEIRKELTTEEWKQLIAKLCSMGITSFAFTGGEPLLRKDIFEIIKFAAAQTCEHIETKNEELVTEFRPPQLYLISNGTLVNEEVLDFCKEYNVHLSMSLPGLTTYKEHTGGVGSFENILHCFGEAKKRGMSTTVNSTTTAKNIFELYNTIA
ncbi:MAG: radical SAM protein, partial [Bacteroidota bacterium]